MTEQVTTYSVLAKSKGLSFLFKYNLNGDFTAFAITEGTLNDKQMFWLYSEMFPATEELMKANWQQNPSVNKLFDIEVSPADVSFEAFYNSYGYKVKPSLTRKAWDKLNESNKILAFKALPKYEKHLKQTGQGRAHPVTWINQERWLDEYPDSEPETPKKQKFGKVINPALQDLAEKKTDK